MPYSSDGYLKRAEECVRLANMTDDDMLSVEILKLRQNYLRVAERLSRIEHGKTQDPES